MRPPGCDTQISLSSAFFIALGVVQALFEHPDMLQNTWLEEHQAQLASESRSTLFDNSTSRKEEPHCPFPRPGLFLFTQKKEDSPPSKGSCPRHSLAGEIMNQCSWV
jgi:hypothetical protein